MRLAEFMQYRKADERGDAVASLSEANEVRWTNRHSVYLIVSDTAH